GSAFYNEVNLLKSHPNLFGWETFDEAYGYGNGVTLNNLTQGYNFVKSLDKAHPILSNENPISTKNEALAERPWNVIGDTFSCDWYPYDSTYTPNYPLYAVEDAQDYDSVPTDSDGAYPYVATKPVYQVIQGFPNGSVVPTY